MITKRVQYRYDSVRNKIGMTDADGGLHTYTYDVMRRLTGVINPLGERTTYAYDLNGRRTSVQLANGTRTSYVYDVASRVQSVHTLKSDDSTVSKFEYEYDGNGRRTSVLEADGSRVTWTYDRISQVTAEWRTGTNPYRHTFTYDSVGNRTLKIEDGARTTLVYDACNQLVTSEDNSGTTTFTYDGNGNQTVVQKPNGDRTTQIWDYENRLIKTIQPSGGVTSMAYDADGLRLKLEEPTGTKLVVWDDQNYLAEADAAGTTQAAFTTEPSTYGSLISHRKSGASTTYHFDALGSTRALTDASETALESYNYSAFGTLLGSPALLTPFLWGGMVGYYWDAALASQYIRARYYQPAIARWISLDPIGFAGGDANLFRYVGNSPTSGRTVGRVKLTASAYGDVYAFVPAGTNWEYGYAMLIQGRGNFHADQIAVNTSDPSGMDSDFDDKMNDPNWTRDFMRGGRGIRFGSINISTTDRLRGLCGEESFVEWTFSIKKRPKCNGFLVQKVTVSCEGKNCKGGYTDCDSFSYWEAWPIFQGDGGKDKLFNSKDTAKTSHKTCTIGSYSQQGELRFYCNSEIGLGLTDTSATPSIPGWDPAGQKSVEYGRFCKTTPRDLTSTGAQPDFWTRSPKKVRGTASRSIETSWSCCNYPGCDRRSGSNQTQLRFTPRD